MTYTFFAQPEIEWGGSNTELPWFFKNSYYIGNPLLCSNFWFVSVKTVELSLQTVCTNCPNSCYKLFKRFVQTVSLSTYSCPTAKRATFPQSFLLRLAMLLTRLFMFFFLGSSETAGLSSLRFVFTKQKIKYTFADTRVQKISIQTSYVKTVQEYETRIGTCVKVMYGNVMSSISLLKMQLWDEHETGSGYYVNCQLSGTAELRRRRKSTRYVAYVSRSNISHCFAVGASLRKWRCRLVCTRHFLRYYCFQETLEAGLKNCLSSLAGPQFARKWGGQHL